MPNDYCVGSDYAYKLNQGLTLAEAWLGAGTCGNTGNPMMVLTTGANNNDCFNRMNTMTFYNYSNSVVYPRYRDNPNMPMCASWIN
jgi:hypothetical protein